MNYFFHENMIYDLENNIPYIYTPYKSLRDPNDMNFNRKNVYSDSSRSICIHNP